MGRNTPPVRRKIDLIALELQRMAPLIGDETIINGLDELVELLYSESAALSASNNPLVYFNFLLIVMAKLLAEIGELKRKISKLEGTLVDQHERDNSQHQH